MLKDLCFEVIQTCPNKCKFCSSNSSQDKQTIITLEQFKKVVMHFIKQGGIEELSIGRGRENKEELMLNEEELKEFSEILRKGKEHYSGNIRI